MKCNKLYCLVLVFFFILLTISCNDKDTIIKYYPNGKIHIVSKPVKGDTADFKCIEYSLDGKLKGEYFLKNGKLNGYGRKYYPNGQIYYEGTWKNGMKEGIFKGYYEAGELRSVGYYIPFKDSTMLNQFLNFNKSGDTLWNQSLYYTIKKFTAKNDTLKFGQPYLYILTLKGHPLNGTTFVYTCNCDSKYNFLPGETPYRDTLEMTNFSIRLAWKNYKLGRNYIRGFIENTTWSPEKSSIPAKSIPVYFSDSIYVVK